jgi:hypothetical protein
MNWRTIAKFTFASALLVAIGLHLLLPPQYINAGLPEPALSTRLNMIIVTENWIHLPFILKHIDSTPIPITTPEVTDTPLPIATNTPVSTAIPEMTFFLCVTEDDRYVLSSTSCTTPINLAAGLVDVRFEVELAGDIVGTNYEFALMLATSPEGGIANVDAKIILDQNGQEIALSSTSFVVDNYVGSFPYDFKLYTASESGLDPNSVAGDHLILSLTNNGPENIWISCKSDDSSITTPGTNK